MDRPTCRTCPYFDKKGTGDAVYGLCRRRAPEVPATEEEMACLFAAWPAVPPEEWCGEHPDFPAWIAMEKGGGEPVNWDVFSVRARRELGPLVATIDTWGRFGCLKLEYLLSMDRISIGTIREVVDQFRERGIKIRGMS